MSFYFHVCKATLIWAEIIENVISVDVSLFVRSRRNLKVSVDWDEKE